MKVCAKCGTKLSSKDLFCNRCGKRKVESGKVETPIYRVSKTPIYHVCGMKTKTNKRKQHENEQIRYSSRIAMGR